ncbi:MAG: imidazole glycerol phosphate synthase subunit HisH [Chitinophagaceae bacterium]
MEVVIIKYNAGNIRSVLLALERMGIAAQVTDDGEKIRGADKVIFPGVGSAGPAMTYLKEKGLDQIIFRLQQPVLGICLGMQLMCRYSEENNTECLGIFPQEIKKFILPAESGPHQMTTWNAQQPFRLKIPQTGWNNIYSLSSPLFKGVVEMEYVYFVHSYFADLGNHTIAQTDYIQPYSSALQRDNFYGVQFHVEKSAEVGQQILSNFLQL